MIENVEARTMATGQLPTFPDCKHPLLYVTLVTSKDGTRQMLCLACGRWFIEKADAIMEVIA